MPDGLLDWFFTPLFGVEQAVETLEEAKLVPQGSDKLLESGREFFLYPGGPIKQGAQAAEGIIPPWFNDNNIFLGGTALGITLLTGGSLLRYARDRQKPRRKRLDARKREKKPKTDYYEVGARTLDKAQLPAAYLTAAAVSEPMLALPFAVSYIQGAENFHLISKEVGDRLQQILAGALIGVTANRMAGAIL